MRRRILLAILLAVTVTAAALGIPLGVTAWELVYSLEKEDLVELAQGIAKRADDDLAKRGKLNIERLGLGLPANTHLVVHRTKGADLEYGPEPTETAITERIELVAGGFVEVSIPSEPLRARQTQVTVAVLFLAVLSVGTGTVVATMTARRLARPLRHVAGRAAKLGAGDFRPDAKRYAVHELDMVAEALDTSAAALSQMVRRERQFVGDVSHQLRSRLTALQLRLDSLTMHADSDVVEDAIAAQEQADQLAKVLDELLAAARAAREVGAEPVDLSSMLPVIAQDWRQVLHAEGRALRLRISDSLIARATPARLREVIGVLLDNARLHGSGTVTLAARTGEKGNSVVVSVSDQGPGVPDGLVPHIFDRGVSGAGSTGVGLALARALVEADGGRLELSAQRPPTFSVFLLLPKSTELAGVNWSGSPLPR